MKMTNTFGSEIELRTKHHAWQKVSWPAEDFAAYKKIYLSSSEDSDILNFYKCFNGRLKLTWLIPANIDEALHGEDCLLIYSTDVFPQCNKIGIRELWNRLFVKKIGNLMRFCYVREPPSLIAENELTACKLIQKFDDGAFSVAVVDEDENFIGTVARETFCRDFPGKSFGVQRNLFLRAEDDETAIRRKTAEIFFETGIREIPLVRDGKVLSSCKIAKTLLLQNREENFPPVYWDAISDAVVKDFLEGCRRVLISSTRGPLKGFRERFGTLVDVFVFDEPTETFLNEDFDFLVCGAEVWENFPTIQFSAHKLYANLLAEEIRRYLNKSGVTYVYVAASEKFQRANEYRVEYSRRMETAPLTFGSSEEDYLVHADKFTHDWNTCGGIRRTPAVPQNFCRQIFLFGACSVIGTFADDEHTLAAFLQARFNESSLACKVVNCGNNGGCSGATINELYRIADSSFHAGDVVVHINDDAWCYAFTENLRNKFSMDDIFKQAGNKFTRPFRDTKSGQHLNAQGNELMANFLFQKLKAFSTPENDDDVAPFFSVTPVADRLIRNAHLKNFLSALLKEKVPVETAGAVVINANPFTLGHRHLIETARRQADFLYIFVVEEDCSEFSFRDRFSLAKANCADLSDVKVLSAGKYMISLITFADYFQKDALKGRTVSTPVADIKLFGQVIAPLLGIKKRFVGSEPCDLLTAKYNQAMRTLLPDFGVEVIEVPRLTTADGEIIRASAVRDLIRRNKLDECQKFLPAATWKFILEESACST